MRKNKPSQTALKVALNVIALGNVPELRSVLPEGIVEANVDLLTAGEITSKKRIQKHCSPGIVSLYKKFDWLLPGQFESFAYRKAFCELNVKNALNNGARQVLVLGAGYDTLSLRLASEYPDVNFFEIDDFSTAELKLRGLVKIGKPENLFVIPEDLGKRDLKNVLDENEIWNSKFKSVIVAEGLLQYLQPSAVKELFQQCNIVTGEKSNIFFTFISKGEDGRPYAGPHSRLMLWILKIAGEPWLWSVNSRELSDLLNETGWKYSIDFDSFENPNRIEFYAAARK